MSSKFIIKGGIPLKGEVKISGYKNSAGAILAATLLSKEKSTISNIPLISDILNQIKILEKMGAKVEWVEKRKIIIDPKNIDPSKLDESLFKKMRISVLLIGPLLARFKKCSVPHPGGDKIGLRPISAHIEAFEKLGVNVKQNGSYFFECGKNLKGKHIILKEFSQTATENLMMFTSLIKGKTIIEMASTEPCIIDLGILLQNMGVKIKGLGTTTIEIEGKETLNGANHKICPDLLEAGTFIIALAVTGGMGVIKNVNPSDLTMFLEKLKEIGVKLQIKENEIIVKKSKKFKSAKIQVLLFPGFHTDLQPQTSVLLTQAVGKSLIHDPLYENRFQHLHELRKLGADIEITDPHRALIFGKTKLIGNKINASDIRSGAALIIAGLLAEGETIVENIDHIDRGYEDIEKKLKKLGANIKRI